VLHKFTTSEVDDLLQACVCVNLRTGARTATQLYNNLLKPTGLKVTQYYMLVTILRAKEITISHLGEAMLLDQTTITRNINRLKESDYVDITRSSADSRIKIITITNTGLTKLEEATPIWLQIQDKIENDIGKEEYRTFLKTLGKLQETMHEYED